MGRAAVGRTWQAGGTRPMSVERTVNESRSVLSPIRTRTWTQINASGGPGKGDTAWEGPGGSGARGGEGHSASSSSCHQPPRPQPSRASTVSPNALLAGGSSCRPAEQLVALLTRTKPGVGQTKCCHRERPMKKPSLPRGPCLFLCWCSQVHKPHSAPSLERVVHIQA